MSFADFPLKPELISNLRELGFHKPTPIQSETIALITDGNDVVAKAKTGSGKTVAFGLGVLEKLDVKRFRIQALIMCPTRELADQVASELRKLARCIHNIKILTLCGGAPLGPQIGSLEHGAHIVIGTPGRLADHIRKGRLKLNHVETLVLDEADRMLDMGFREQILEIVNETPQSRQTLLFSATYPKEMESINASVLNDPKTVDVEDEIGHSNIQEYFYCLNGEERTSALIKLLQQRKPDSCIVFCHTKIDVQQLADELNSNQIKALALHGDMDQKDRDSTLVRFANKSSRILIATDVAARGLDIDDVSFVVNYQIAKNLDVHTHRVGRTGRAQQTGEAFSLFNDKERFKLERLIKDKNIDLTECTLPDDSVLLDEFPEPDMKTLQIDGGKKQKIRPGDILGALTSDGTLHASEVGKIKIFPLTAFVAVKRSVSKKALKRLGEGKLKGRQFKVREIRS